MNREKALKANLVKDARADEEIERLRETLKKPARKSLREMLEELFLEGKVKRAKKTRVSTVEKLFLRLILKKVREY